MGRVGRFERGDRSQASRIIGQQGSAASEAHHDIIKKSLKGFQGAIQSRGTSIAVSAKGKGVAPGPQRNAEGAGFPSGIHRCSTISVSYLIGYCRMDTGGGYGAVLGSVDVTDEFLVFVIVIVLSGNQPMPETE